MSRANPAMGCITDSDFESLVEMGAQTVAANMALYLTAGNDESIRKVYASCDDDIYQEVILTTGITP